MIYNQEWNKIISKLTEASMELPTVPTTNRKPVWFSVKTDGNKIYINEALHNSPSSNLKEQRKLKYDEFQKIYPLYLRRKNGEKVSQEATSITRNQVYYYSLIEHLVFG